MYRKLAGEKLVAYRAYQREWMKKYRQNPLIAKRGSQQAREWQLKNPIRFAFSSYSRRAKRKQYEFEFTIKEFEQMLKASCYYCGAIPPPFNGIDRIDSSIGYTKLNSVTACQTCNLAKNDLSIREFTSWIERVSNHMLGGANGVLC
jgi:hypothetical protein